MRIRRNISIYALGLVLIPCGCMNSPEIMDSRLNDRVKACAVGFSEETQLGLHASLSKAPPSGELTADIKEETKGIIFSEVADKDKVKVYEDYIGCIEKNWN